MHYEPNFLERKWVEIFDGTERPAVRLAIVLFLWHEFVFVTRYIPYMIADRIPYFRQFKIQDVSIFIAVWLASRHQSMSG